MDGVCRPLGQFPEGGILLQRQNTHILFGFNGKGHSLAVVLTIPGFYPGEDKVASYVASIMGQLGTSTFLVCEVILDIVLECLEGHGEVFAEVLTNLGIVIIDREMAKQMVFEIVDGVEMDEVNPDGMMEVFKVYTETEITSISHPGDNIRFAGGQVFVQSGHKFSWQLGAEGFNRSEILLFAFCELLIIGTKEIGQVGDNTFTYHEVFNFFDSFHINQSF